MAKYTLYFHFYLKTDINISVSDKQNLGDDLQLGYGELLALICRVSSDYRAEVQWNFIGPDAPAYITSQPKLLDSTAYDYILHLFGYNVTSDFTGQYCCSGTVILESFVESKSAEQTCVNVAVLRKCVIYLSLPKYNTYVYKTCIYT